MLDKNRAYEIQHWEPRPQTSSRSGKKKSHRYGVLRAVLQESLACELFEHQITKKHSPRESTLMNERAISVSLNSSPLSPTAPAPQKAKKNNDAPSPFLHVVV
jgi:hypothetical protein